MSQTGPPQVPSTPSGGLEKNIAAALAYIPILAIVWLILEPYNKDRYIRFHSFQSLALAVSWIGVSIVLGMIPILGWIILVFLPFAILVVAVICAVKAYQNEMYKLPVLGDFAEKQAGAA